MKKLLISAALALVAPSALACINVTRDYSVCVGDTVYSGTTFSSGATVLAINPSIDVVTVQSKRNFEKSRMNLQDLDLANACMNGVCTDDTIYMGDRFSSGARVLGVNLFQRTLTVQSKRNFELAKIRIEEAHLTKGCIGDVCVGDIVYKGDLFSSGANVIAINELNRSATVQSRRNFNLSLEKIRDLDVTKGCLAGVCVGDVVFKGSQYSSGANVLAINYAQLRATVQSRRNFDLYSEDIRGLDVGTADSRYSNTERYSNSRSENQEEIDQAVDTIVDAIIDAIVGEPVATCTVVNSSGNVIGSNIAKTDFVTAVINYALDERSCVIANEKGVTRSHFVIGARGEVLGSGLSEREASDVRDAFGYSRCRRATCQ